MPPPALSPYDRIMRRRRRTLARDWILVLIALGLAAAAGLFRGDRPTSEAPAATVSAPAVP
jgi:hypothetical protein